MKWNFTSQPGIGFTIAVAAATFIVAVMAGLFLILEPDAGTFSHQDSLTQVSLAAPFADE